MPSKNKGVILGCLQTALTDLQSANRCLSDALNLLKTDFPEQTEIIAMAQDCHLDADEISALMKYFRRC